MDEMLSLFIRTKCTVRVGAQIGAAQLHDAYKTYCNNKGLKPKSLTWFGRQMREQYNKEKTASGFVYQGIDVDPSKSDDDDVFASIDANTNEETTQDGTLITIIKKTIIEMQRQTPLAIQQRMQIATLAIELRQAMAAKDWQAVERIAEAMEEAGAEV